MKCDKCPNILCINLFRKDEIDEKAGGELHILKQVLDKTKGKLIFHNAGGVLCFLEDVLIGAMEDNKISLLNMHAWQCIRDLKTSLFLAFCGHLRQSMIIIRVALEMFVFGMYFQIKEYEDDEKLEEEWQAVWKGSPDRPSFSSTLRHLSKKNILTEDQEKTCRKLYYHEFSICVHTLAGGDVWKLIEDEELRLPLRPSSGFIKLHDLKDWFGIFVKICTFITNGYLVFSPQIKEDRKKALDSLRRLLADPNIEEKALEFTQCPQIAEINSRI